MKKRNRKKTYNRKRRSFSVSEKKSFKRGFLRGLKKSNSSKQRSADKIVAQRYASHMGRKFDLSAKEVEKNAREHYNEMQTDLKFAHFVRQNYGIGVFYDD